MHQPYEESYCISYAKPTLQTFIKLESTFTQREMIVTLQPINQRRYSRNLSIFIIIQRPLCITVCSQRAGNVSKSHKKKITCSARCVLRGFVPPNAITNTNNSHFNGSFGWCFPNIKKNNNILLLYDCMMFCRYLYVHYSILCMFSLCFTIKSTEIAIYYQNKKKIKIFNHFFTP